jgi:uncharacterized integral membrane protein
MSERDPRVEEPTGEPRAERPPAAQPDPLRGSRTSGFWGVVVVLVVVLVLLAVFVLQNTQQVEVSFFGWTGSAPLAAALLIATAAGLLIAVSAGALRILQLRRRVRRAQRR